MSKRGENIRKRKDGRWEGRFKARVNENGCIKYRSLYGKTYGEVKEKMRVAKASSVISGASARHSKTFSEVLKLWLNAKRVCVKESTLYKYEYLVNRHIIPELGNTKVSDITCETINTYLERKIKNGRLDKKGGLSPVYVKAIMLIISQALKFAADEGYCLPLRNKINKPLETKNDIAILDAGEQRKIEAFSTIELSPTTLGILLSLHTGLRIGEVCALSWADVDFTNLVLHVRHTVARVAADKAKSGTSSCLIIDLPKTKASRRDIPISSFLLPFIQQMRKAAVSEFVVSNKMGFLSPRTYEYRYHKVLSLCGVGDINYHALRHTFATRCVEAGVDVKSLSEILGHADVSVTLNTYVHSSMSLKRRELEKLAASRT